MKMERLKNEKGIALVMVILLSAISLALMAALIYMIMSQTEISGIQKRYKTAQEAGLGGTAVAYQLISERGNLTGLPALWSYTTVTPSNCTGTSGGTTYPGIFAKIMTASSTWSAGCSQSLAIDPTAVLTADTSYDMSFELGTGTTYKVYAKIVDTVEGNSGGDEGLLKSGVVAANSGEVTVQSKPYLYTIEMLAQSTTNPQERAKLSILYQY